jgi:hypothetical protein
VAGLKELRARLPRGVALWVGGSGMECVRKPISGVTIMHSLEEVLAALHAWRETHRAS